ncbi:MAG: Na+/H+ antiporter NhaC family protein [Dorea sp.]|nr:Na+/H+ antiporter NhaC family protein [Dorea sp.]
MEPISAGWLSILPPVLAIIMALITKDVIFSLLLGILSGTITYCAMAGTNLLVGPVEVMFNTAIDKIDLNIILFVFMLGAMVQVIAASGGSRAYGKWAQNYLKTKKSTLISTMILGILIFVDDYFNCLTVGTVMSPLTDRHKVSRAKLAYLIDSTAAPVCIIAPVSSWAAAVGSNLQSTGAFKSDLIAFCSTIPYNLYALLTLFMVFILAVKELDYGPMLTEELKARADVNNYHEALINQVSEREVKDKVSGSSSAAVAGAVTGTGAITKAEEKVEGVPGTVADMLLPIVSLIILSILGMLYNGGFWDASGESYHSLIGAFGNCTAAQALAWGGFGALIIAFLMYIPRKMMTFKDFMNGVTEGFKNMVGANAVLLFAWTISGVCRDLLMTAEFVRDLFASSHIPGALLPAIIFVVAAFLSFSIGSSWGTFGILIPIIVPVATALSGNLLIVSLAATLGGSIFGDHCSPISDTTILSSTGAGCDHLLHVSTQIPYAITVAVCCILGYLVAGFTDGNLIITLLFSFVLLIVTMVVLHKRSIHVSEA